MGGVSRQCTEVLHEMSEVAVVDTAIDELERLVDDGRADAVAPLVERLHAKALLFADADDVDGVRAVLDQAIERAAAADADAAAMLELGRVWTQLSILAAGSHDIVAAADAAGEEVAAFRRAYELAPGDEVARLFAIALNRLGLRCWELDYHDSAMRALDEGLALASRHPVPAITVGHLWLNRGNTLHTQKSAAAARASYDAALEAFAKAGTDDARRSSAYAYLGRGNVMSKDRSNPNRFDDFERAREILLGFPDDAQAAGSIGKLDYNLGITANVEERYDDALRHFTAAVEHTDELVDRDDRVEHIEQLACYRANRARVLARLGALAAACAEMSEAVDRIEPLIADWPNRQLQRDLTRYKADIVTWERERARRVPVRRVPDRRPRVSAPDDVHCSFCGRTRQEVERLVSGPRAFICDICVELSLGLLAQQCPKGADGVRSGPTRTVAPACGFCGRTDVLGIVKGPSVQICDDCTDLAAEVVVEERQKLDDEAACVLCDRSRLDVDYLVRCGSHAVCSACVAEASGLLDAKYPRDGRGVRGGTTRTIPGAACVWCATNRARTFIDGGEHRLCDACLDAARAAG